MIQKIWDFFNGKKMIIGAVLANIVIFDQQVLIGIWQVTWPWLEQANSTMSWFAMAFGAVGGVHKIAKAMTKANIADDEVVKGE